METNVPQKFIDIINDVGDEVLSDEQKVSNMIGLIKLVGKVHKEVQIPFALKRTKIFFKVMQACVDYLNILSKRTEHISGTINGRRKDTKPTVDNIHLTHSWIVSQYVENIIRIITTVEIFQDLIFKNSLIWKMSGEQR